MMNIDLNDSVLEIPGVSDSLGIDVNCIPGEGLGSGLEYGIDLNRTVPELETGVDLNTGLINCEEKYKEKRRLSIDLNLDAKYDMEIDGVCALERQGGFDLNLEANDDGLFVQTNGHEVVEVTNRQEDNIEAGECEGFNATQDQLLVEIPKESSQDLNTPDSNVAEQDRNVLELVAKTVDESLSERVITDERRSGRRKRRKGSEIPKVVSQTQLRRSSRGKSAQSPVSSPATACLALEVSPSPLLEEKTRTADTNAEDLSVLPPTAEDLSVLPPTADTNAEDLSVLPPKPQLPPSSQILNFDGLSVHAVFRAYAILRSFSALLFLSPFELTDFVEAIRSTSPTLLFDSVHVSVLQVLREQLKQLATDGNQSATTCLRRRNWDMLDEVTYPLFVAEYLLYFGFKNSSGTELTRLNFFGNEYFRQPINLKIEILSSLCDDITDTNAVKSEISRRIAAAESEMELDKKTNKEARRRKRTMMELTDDLATNDKAIEGSLDQNSDECRLCKMVGSLLCCDGCPAAYHSKCVGISSSHLPEGDWYCPECSFEQRQPGLKPEKKIRGAEFVETDPHGRRYYSSFNYLLVVDSNGPDGSETCNYYHVNDVIHVLEQLKPCSRFYSGVINAIKKQWDVQPKSIVSGVNSEPSVILDKPAEVTVGSTDGFKAPLPAPEKHSTSGVKRKLDETSSNGGHRRSRRMISNSASGLDIVNVSSAETLQNGLHEQQPNSDIHLSTDNLDRRNTRQGIRPTVKSETGYQNQYVFAQMTTAIAKEIMPRSPISTDDVRSDEEIASTQVKTMLMKTTKFQWRYFQSLYLDAWKEKCGWCHSCKSEGAGGGWTDCLFNMSLGALGGPSESEVANSQSTDNSHLMAIICQILSMESRLQGLLVGPWLNPRHSRIWREHVLKASSISSLKHLLIQLEANLHHRVVSVEWLNHVDSEVMGSAIHFSAASTRSWSKTAVCKTRGGSLEFGISRTLKKNVGLTMCWWRGGKISRRLFNSKVLPRSLISKAARQGGSLKIPGVLYAENSDSTKRSRRVAWEADVESSTTSALLGFQVRTLHSYIKWDDIENSHLLPASDKDSKRSARLFRKVIVRRKCIEEETVKYLLDFGKRKYVPDVVLDNGSTIEETSSGRKRFWLNESYVPLHLLKAYEEKKAVRRTSKPVGYKLSEVRTISSQRKGFSYLFEKAERLESSLGEQCRKDVPLREAACCHICKRSFHKRHIKRAEKEGMYICLQCKSKMQAKEQPVVRKRGRPPGSLNKRYGFNTQNKRRVMPARKSVRITRTKTSLAEKISVTLRNRKKVVASKPLRRSGRSTKQILRLQDENKVVAGSRKRKLEAKRGRDRPTRQIIGDESKVVAGSKKRILEPKRGRGRSKRVKPEISIRKKRSGRFLIHWLNGLQLSMKPGDERVNKFRGDRYYTPLENAGSDHDPPKCYLCSSNESESTLISCETCKKWYHGDAFGLKEENSAMVIGFRCHDCLKKPRPICPHM